MFNLPINPMQRRMNARLREIARAYDFQTFTVSDFAAWLAAQRGRPLSFVPFALPAPLFGAWLQGEDRDFIFYERDTSPLHQAHIQIHELAHILCGHPTIAPGTPAGDAFVEMLTRQTAEASPSPAGSVALRFECAPEQEREAETLAALIQRRVLRHAGLDRLMSSPSSDQALDSYLRSLNLA